MNQPEMFPPIDTRKPWQRSDQIPIDADRAHVGRRHPITAQRMQAKVLPRSGTFRRQMFDTLRQQPMTDDELEIYFGRSHQSVSGCRSTLFKDGWLRNTGDTRRNRYGNDAIVWGVVDG